jgi:alcohol dehydrogenase class IV
MIAEAFGIDTQGLDDKAAAWKAICAVKDLVRRMGAPSGLRELGVPETDLPILAELVMHDPYSRSNPRSVTPPQAEQVLRWAWTGDIPPMEQAGVD